MTMSPENTHWATSISCLGCNARHAQYHPLVLCCATAGRSLAAHKPDRTPHTKQVHPPQTALLG